MTVTECKVHRLRTKLADKAKRESNVGANDLIALPKGRATMNIIGNWVYYTYEVGHSPDISLFVRIYGKAGCGKSACPV